MLLAEERWLLGWTEEKVEGELLGPSWDLFVSRRGFFGA